MTDQSEKAGPKPGDLLLTVPGAGEADIARGLAAAWKVITGAGCTAYEAAEASWVLEGEEMESGAVLTDKQSAIAHVWGEAIEAAVITCCGDRRKVPEDWDFQLILPPRPPIP